MQNRIQKDMRVILTNYQELKNKFMIQATYGDSQPYYMHYILKNNMANIYLDFNEEDLVHDSSSLYYEIMQRGHAPDTQEIYDEASKFRDLLMKKIIFEKFQEQESESEN